MGKNSLKIVDELPLGIFLVWGVGVIFGLLGAKKGDLWVFLEELENLMLLL